MATESREDVPTGGPYTAGPNKYTGGGTTVNDVSPLEDRADGTGEEQKQHTDSISRQLPS